MADNPKDEEYKIGYKRPPIERRWKKGQSGNKSGRPRQGKSIGAAVEQALLAKISVTENGRVRKLTMLEVALKQLAKKAASGDRSSTKMLIDLFKDVSPQVAAEPMIVRVIGGLPDRES